MPIFEFVCLSCGDSFDKLLRGSSSVSEVVCPSCDSGEIKKKLSVFSSQISGGASRNTTASCAPGGL